LGQVGGRRVGCRRVGCRRRTDPETLEESTIASEASAHSIHLHEEGGELLVSYFNPDLDNFGISLAKPEHHGVWLTKPVH
jgi:hypothetical protein